MSVTKVLEYALVKTDVRRQLLARGICVTPHYSAAKFTFVTEGVELL